MLLACYCWWRHQWFVYGSWRDLTSDFRHASHATQHCSKASSNVLPQECRITSAVWSWARNHWWWYDWWLKINDIMINDKIYYKDQGLIINYRWCTIWCDMICLKEGVLSSLVTLAYQFYRTEICVADFLLEPPNLPGKSSSVFLGHGHDHMHVLGVGVQWVTPPIDNSYCWVLFGRRHARKCLNTKTPQSRSSNSSNVSKGRASPNTITRKHENNIKLSIPALEN